MVLARTLRYTLSVLFPRLPVERILLSTFASMLEHRVIAAPEELLLRLAPQEALSSLCGDLSSCLLIPAHAWGPALRWMRIRSHNSACLIPVVGVAGLRECLASETAHYNLRNRLGVRGRVLRVRLWTEPLCQPRFAATATVALLASGGEAPDREALDAALAQFFSTPRLAAVGDVLRVDMCRLVPRLRYSRRGAGVFYVRVTELAGLEPSYILKDSTAISQGPDCAGSLPPSRVKLAPGGLPLPRCPPGLESCLEQLQAGLRPFLSGDGGPLPGVRAAFMVRGPRGAGKTQLANALAKALGVATTTGNCAQLRGSSARAADQCLLALLARSPAPCLLRLRRLDALARGDSAEAGEDAARLATFRASVEALPPGVALLALASADNDDATAVSGGLARCFLRVISLPAPDAPARAASLRWACQCAGISCAGVDLDAVASAAAGFLLGDLQALAAHAMRLAYQRGRSQEGMAEPTQVDFDAALDLMSRRMATASGAPQVAKVTWNDVGGHSALKADIQRLLDPPAALAAAGLRRAGVLLYGPPGGGKTLLAKACAHSGARCFLSVKGPELLSAYVGQSEAAVRQVFARARAAAPCLVFLDELDALAPVRGRSGDSAGVMDRVVSQLLSEMDGLQSKADVIVMAATNRPDLIDPALMRPGRLDKLLYVGPCESRADRLAVLSALTRRMRLAPCIDLERIVRSLTSPQTVGCTPGGVDSNDGGVASNVGGVASNEEGVASGLTGADLMALASAAWNQAARRAVHRMQAGGNPALEADGVMVEAQDFQAAAANLGPSVSADDLAYFKQLHSKLAAGAR